MEVLTTGLTGQLLQGVLAIVLGVGGMMGYYFGANALVDMLDDKIRSAIRPWVFIAPALLVLGLFLVYPTVQTIIISFYGPDTEEFVGLANYEWALGYTDGQPNAPEIWQSFRNNLLWLLIVPAFSTGFGLLVAILADRVSWENLAKAIIFLPMAISFVGASVIWRFIYFRDPDVGLLNAIAVGLGGEPVSWLSTTYWSNFPLMIILIWIQAGFAMVLLSAALKAVPEETLEAARIDGANEITIFFQIIIPQITSTIAVVMTTIIILVLKVFDIVFVMTSGNFSTEVLANLMYRQMFRFGDFGRGSVVALLLMLAVVPVMYINIRRFQREEELR